MLLVPSLAALAWLATPLVLPASPSGNQETGAAGSPAGAAVPPPDVAAWLHDHAIPLASVQAGHGFADLEPLAAVVGDARIVALGEATHGTREFFQMKHRLLEFLVERMGFTLFGIEANWPESLAVNDYVLHGTGDPRKALAGMYFWTWNTEEVLAQIEWMRGWNADPQHAKKVQFLGFDMQTPNVAARRLLDYLKRVDPVTVDEAGALLERIAQQGNGGGGAPLPGTSAASLRAKKEEEAALLEKIVENFDELRDDYLVASADEVAGESAHESAEAEWASIRQHAVIVLQAYRIDFPAGGSSAAGWRDRCMADNARWLLGQAGPEARIVLWAHNGHVARDGLRQMASMGHFLTGDAALHPQENLSMVVLGFAFARGSFQARAQGGGELSEFTVDGPDPAGHEAALIAAGLSDAIVPLKGLPEAGPVHDFFATPRSLRTIGAMWSKEFDAKGYDRTTCVLPESFDALIFLRETTRARPVGFKGR